MEPPKRLVPVNRCPDRRVLADFHAGRLSDSVLCGLGAHVDSCPACSAAIGEIVRAAGDDLVDRLKGCLRDGEPPDLLEPAFQKMAAAAAALPIGQHGGDTDTSDGTEFTVVAPSERETWVGPYQVLEVIGRGGMGVVFKARHGKLNRLAAVKMLRAGDHASEETRDRFRVEGEAVARLDHPNIARLYEFGEHAGLPYFAMEWVEGGTLAKRLSAGPLGFREAADLIRTLGLAVDFAHHRQVLHRDLKPANVLLTAGGTPKVADFGLAKLLDTDDGLTSPDAVFGTPSYMAPEQAAGRAATLTQQADVYALGAILYETLTGRPPFLGRTKSETLRLVGEGQLVRPSQYRPDLPADLEAVCLKCLEPDPARRYPSAGELADDLGRWLAGEPTKARPLGRVGRAARAVMHRRRALAVGAAALGAIGAGAWYLRGSGPDRASRDNPRAARELEAKLIRDGEVTLIGDTGRPRWYRWQEGNSRGSVTTEPDGTFVVTHPSTGLLELLADPITDRYQLTAQVRHDRSDEPSLTSEVGVYVGHQFYPTNESSIHFIVQLSFNSAYIYTTNVGTGGVLKLHVKENPIQLRPRVIEKEGETGTDGVSHEYSGPSIRPFGEYNGLWYTVGIIVDRDALTASVEMSESGSSGGNATVRIDMAQIEKLMPLIASPKAPAMHFAGRAGLGLFVLKSSAAFRRVEVRRLRDAKGDGQS